MLRFFLFGLLTATLTSLPSPLNGQVPEDLTRAGRVVVHSPHFDAPEPVRGSFPCIVRPLRLLGFETDSVADQSRLSIRVGRQSGEPPIVDSARRPTPPRFERVLISLKPLNGDSLTAPARILTDAEAHADFAAPPGLYELEVSHIGFRGGIGVIRLREQRSDSLWIGMDPSVICAPGVQPN